MSDSNQSAQRRFVIVGAGAIGATIGARLFQTGRDVVFVARGRHGEVLRRDGLLFEAPDGSQRIRIPTFETPADAGLSRRDIVVLAVKGEDSAQALDDLSAAAGAAEPAIVCAQNGVENERLALRRFANVYGMLVVVAGQHLVPGVVQTFCEPVRGVLDLGRVPSGVDRIAQMVAADLRTAGFEARAVPDVMRFKYGKLAGSVSNAIGAVLGASYVSRALRARAMAEAYACFEAAGIDAAGSSELGRRMALVSPEQEVAGTPHYGSSMWQSLERAAGHVEANYLNGEVVLLSRLHGAAAPLNELLLRLVTEMAARNRSPGEIDQEWIDEIRRFE